MACTGTSLSSPSAHAIRLGNEVIFSAKKSYLLVTTQQFAERQNTWIEVNFEVRYVT
jgi:tRNA A37 N6-isopentenylltransferase MiaA